MSKPIVKTLKPRNPLVAAARFRQAGAHGADRSGMRRECQLALKRELATLDRPRDVRGKPPSI